MPRITFKPADVTIEVEPGTTVFSAAAKAEVAIPSQCGGKCACALCRVTVLSGEDLVSPMTWEEEGHMGNVFYLTRERLSCQMRVFGDLVVQVAEAPKEKARGRYIPYALVRKREKMEKEEELRRVRAGARELRPARESDRTPSASDREEGPPPRPPRTSAPSKRRGRRRRSRNPGAPRVGDHRPPPGAKKKDTE